MHRSLGLTLLLTALSLSAQDLPIGRMTQLNGMLQPGMVIREANGIPHVFALNTHDAWFLNGWLHAQDRFFQMDTSRRIASGTLGELLGSAALSNDVQLRTLGLRRAAEATLPTVSTDGRAALDAYTQGVNAYLHAHPGLLPPEYALLGITAVSDWVPADTIAIGKLLAFGLSFDLDLDATIALISYQTAGTIVHFDGTKLFTDTWRIAPFSKAAVIPDATGTGAAEPIHNAAEGGGVPLNTDWIKPETIALLQAYREQIRDNDVLQAAVDPERHAGSNEWAIAPRNSSTGNALIANDPHLSFSEPPNFYPISIRVPGKLNVAGMGFPGAPFVIQGQNERIAWGSTVHPMDVTDLYQEQFVPDATSPSGFSSLYLGKKENVLAIPQTYRINTPGSGLSVVPAAAGLPPVTLIVPRHGPVLSPPDTKTGVAISVQYTGFYPTHELEAFMLIDQAKNVDDFKNALQFFDVGSQNFAYADIDGNIAYLTSGELPIREDLQAMKVNGVPPYFVRNGQGGNEWMAVAHPQPQQAMPFEILPYSEMPQVVNPVNGWFVNANNDPIGQTLDNDPLNTLRPGGGILYLNPGYDGIRAGRITQVVRQKLANGGKLSVADMKAIQADTVLLDAEVFVPFIAQAMANARASGADPILSALGSNPIVAAAVGQLATWDFSTPTGLDTGYDVGETSGTTRSAAEISRSVSATLYAAWRSKFMANTIDVVLKTLTVPLPPQQQTLSALRFQLENFSTTGGRGASGLSFFNVPMVNDAAARRDILILKSVADAVQMLASDEFAPAFNKSTNLTDYRWGKLHRVVFAHVMGNLYSPGAPFGQPPLPSVVNLPGVARQGGMSTVDAATHNARANTLNGFMFTSGPNRRYVGDMSKFGPIGQSALPGGVSGDPRSPWFTNLLMQWLVNDTFPVVPDSFPRIPWLP